MDLVWGCINNCRSHTRTEQCVLCYRTVNPVRFRGGAPLFKKWGPRRSPNLSGGMSGGHGHRACFRHHASFLAPACAVHTNRHCASRRRTQDPRHDPGKGKSGLPTTDVTSGQFQTHTAGKMCIRVSAYKWRSSPGMYLLREHQEIELQALSMSGRCTRKGTNAANANED